MTNAAMLAVMLLLFVWTGFVLALANVALLRLRCWRHGHTNRTELDYTGAPILRCTRCRRRRYPEIAALCSCTHTWYDHQTNTDHACARLGCPCTRWGQA